LLTASLLEKREDLLAEWMCLGIYSQEVLYGSR
jgi:hypothetical protein